MWISSLAEDVGREVLLLCCSLLRPGSAENFLSIGSSRSSRLQDEPLNKDLMLHRIKGVITQSFSPIAYRLFQSWRTESRVKTNRYLSPATSLRHGPDAFRAETSYEPSRVHKRQRRNHWAAPWSRRRLPTAVMGSRKSHRRPRTHLGYVLQESAL
jgi:hypothetical protein